MNDLEIIQKIRANKKYSDITLEIIEEELARYKKKNPQIERYSEKKIIKEIRRELHRAHGSFHSKGRNKRAKFLEELKKNPNNTVIIKNILLTNKSTKERIEIYPELYQKIFRITGIPKTMVDLGSGINGVSVAFMKLDRLEYYSYDINEEDARFLNEFFKISEVEGKSDILDCSKLNNLKKLPQSDMVLMFKFLDTIEKSEKGHKLAEEIIKTIIENTKFIVASFSKLTITGKPMNFPYRGWIERMLERIGLKFQVLDFPNEIFYIISKSKL